MHILVFHHLDTSKTFKLLLPGQMGRLDVGVETLPCTRYNSVCQANVILLRRLEPGRYVDFRLSVRNTRGRSTRIACSIMGTNATTPRDTIFPHQPSIILVPEVSYFTKLFLGRTYFIFLLLSLL